MADHASYISLEDIRVATPCRASWARMQGDDRVRFCQTCAKNVYNLSAISQTQAEALIREKEGELCVRFYQRDDGTMLTGDCPVGLKTAQRRFAGGIVAGLAACIAFGFGLIGIGNSKMPLGQSISQLHSTIMKWVRPTPEPMMGSISTTINLQSPSSTDLPNPAPPVNYQTDETHVNA